MQTLTIWIVQPFGFVYFNFLETLSWPFKDLTYFKRQNNCSLLVNITNKNKVMDFNQFLKGYFNLLKLVITL